MEQQQLSCLIERAIDELLAQHKIVVPSDKPVMRVVLSGDDLSTLPTTVDCLRALARCGYFLSLAFSHSAAQSSLQASCLQMLHRHGIELVHDDRESAQIDYSCSGLYLPALSTNSMSKMALGIRDNLVCRAAFHALSLHQQVIVTLNGECQGEAGQRLPVALRERLAGYVSTLVEYGFTVLGQQYVSVKKAVVIHGERRLITLSHVRQHPDGQPLHIHQRTLITPAARDEIRRRAITMIQQQ